MSSLLAQHSPGPVACCPTNAIWHQLLPALATKHNPASPISSPTPTSPAAAETGTTRPCSARETGRAGARTPKESRSTEHGARRGGPRRPAVGVPSGFPPVARDATENRPSSLTSSVFPVPRQAASSSGSLVNIEGLTGKNQGRRMAFMWAARGMCTGAQS